MRKTIAAMTATGALTVAALLTPPTGYAVPTDTYMAVCDAYRAEALGLVVRGVARPVATRMLVVAGTSPVDAPAVIQFAITNRCREYINLL